MSGFLVSELGGYKSNWFHKFNLSSVQCELMGKNVFIPSSSICAARAILRLLLFV